MEEGRVEAAMAALDDNDEAASVANSLLGEAWMAVASQYILKRCRLKQKIQQEEGIRKKRKGGWHPKPRQYVFWGRDTSSASPAELWEHDHTHCKLWRWIQPDSSPSRYEQRQFLEQFGVPRDVYFYYYDILKEEPGFADRVRGDGKSGRRSKPLHLDAPRRVYYDQEIRGCVT